MSDTIKPAEFQSFRTWLRGKSGIDLEDGKEYLVENRLATIARDRDTTLSGVLGALNRDPRLAEDVIDAMTTNETSWFRDVHPFDALRTEVLPALLERNATTRSLSILSGACSTGQEAYSLAMMLRTSFPQLASWRVRIDGIDLSRYAVKRASEARYSQLEVNRGLPATMLRYFRQEGRDFVVNDDLRAWTSFRQMNLLGQWGAMGPYDISLLRNVLIYFDLPTKQAILRKLAGVTRPGGLVILGSSETTISLDVPLTPERMGKTTFYRTADKETAGSWTSPALTSNS